MEGNYGYVQIDILPLPITPSFSYVFFKIATISKKWQLQRLQGRAAAMELRAG